jgi:FtsP/CotA-like multicopper oxidase with cupredoxin domain
MSSNIFSRRRPALLLALLLALLAIPSRGGAAVAAAPVSDSGMVCTSDTSTPGHPSFSLTTQTGYTVMPDGNTVFMWGLSSGAAGFQSPAPILCVSEGDTVTIVLHNTLGEATSLIFPGQEGVLADGALAQPELSGGVVTSLTKAAAPGGSVTYSFVAGSPGTYLYESGTNPNKQVQMGLYGALIVRPSQAPYAYDPALVSNYAYGVANDHFKYSTAHEYVMIFSEVDPDVHAAVEVGEPYDATAYAPKYWLINGRSFPDTIAPNGASWLPTQPYSALVHIRARSSDPASSDYFPALVRMLNVGKLTHAFHPHGADTHIIARDGRPLADSPGVDQTYDKFLIDMGAGQTWDATYAFVDVEHWSPANPIPVPLPQQQNLTYKDSATWYSGSPYLGFKGTLPNGVVSYNACGEFYHVWHSHALNEATNYGVGFGGMFTLARIDPTTGVSSTGGSC